MGKKRNQRRIEARIFLSILLLALEIKGLLFQTSRPKKVFEALERETAKMDNILVGVVVIIFCFPILSFSTTYSKRKIALRSKSLMKRWCRVMVQKLLAKETRGKGRAQIFLQGNDSLKFIIYGVGFPMVQMIFLANYLHVTRCLSDSNYIQNPNQRERN